MDKIEAAEHSLAYELLIEVKHSARRWFVAFCVMTVLEICTLIGFLWYISLPQEESSIKYAQEITDVQDSDNMRQLIIPDGEYDGKNEADGQ